MLTLYTYNYENKVQNLFPLYVFYLDGNLGNLYCRDITFTWGYNLRWVEDILGLSLGETGHDNNTGPYCTWPTNGSRLAIFQPYPDFSSKGG